MRPSAPILTCEHGGNRVPAEHRATLRGAGRALATHRGHDAGALQLARQLARSLDAPLFACTVTRLLVDPNRSIGHRQLFSEWSRRLDARAREDVVERYWRPHRDAVDAAVDAALASGHRVVHVSVHSFTPVWDGEPRDVDVGLLYDPSRGPEKAFATAWARDLSTRLAPLRVRRNQPYRGAADGLTKSLRGRTRPDDYVGIELEVSQGFPAGPAAAWRRLRADLTRSLAELLVRTDG